MAGGVSGVGEKEPNGLGEHRKGGGGEVHEAEAPRAAREEGDVLTRKKVGGEGDFFFSSAGGGGEAGNCALHRDEVSVRVRGVKAHLVDCFGGEALVGCVDAAEEARVEVHPPKSA